MEKADPIAARRELERLSQVHNLDGPGTTRDWDIVNADAARVAEYAQMLDELQFRSESTVYIIGSLLLLSLRDRLEEGVSEDDPAVLYAVAQVQRYRQELHRTLEMELMSGAKDDPQWRSFLERHVL